MSHFLFKQRMFAGAVGLALLSSVTASQAATILSTGDILLGGVQQGPYQDGPATSGSVDIIPFVNDANGNNGFIHTFGNVNGTFGSRSSGLGDYDVTGTFNYNDTITNTGSVNQNLSFSFTVIPGNLTVDDGGVIFGAGQQVGSSINIDIMINGVSLFNSFTQLLLTGDGATNTTSFSETGTSLGGTLSGNGYSYNSFSQTVSLGTLAPGASLNFDYILETVAFGNVSGGCSTGGGDIPLAVITEVPGGGLTGCGSSFVNSGDPLTVGGPTNTFQFNVTVPEPGSILLWGAGLAGLSYARRRQQKNSVDA